MEGAMSGMSGVATSILVVRSARSPSVAAERLRGRLPEPLDEVGRMEADRVATGLAVEEPVWVYSSPLPRAVQTAETIGRKAGVPVTSLDELTEVDLGSWSGKSVEEATASDRERYDLFFRFPRSGEPPSGERMWDAERRALRALAEMGERHPGGRVVAVTHELVIRLVLASLRMHDGTALWDPDLPTVSITQLRYVGGELQLATILEDLFRAARRR